MREPSEPGAKNFQLARKISVAFSACLISLLFSSGALPSETPQDKSWGILEDGLSEHKTSKRAAAVQALGYLQGNARAIELAEKALADKKPEVRAAAATALGRIGTRSSLVLLKIVMTDKENRVAFAAADAVISLGDSDGYDPFYMALTGERKSSDGWIPEKKRLILNPWAMFALGYGAGLGYIPYAGYGTMLWREVSKDYVSPVHIAAMKRLANDTDARIGAALVKQTSDRHPAVRAAALAAIATHGDPGLIPAITAHLTDKKAEVRYMAAAGVLRLSKLDSTETAGFD